VRQNTFLMAIMLTVMISLLAILLPGSKRPTNNYLPWQVTLLPEGNSAVFGLTLGQSSVADAEMQFSEQAVISLFVGHAATDNDHITDDALARAYRSRESDYSVEAYFDQVEMSGLRARAVLEVALSESELAAIYNRGLRISTLGSGVRKVTLSAEDEALVRQSPIATITYLPRADLDEATLRHRFGEPTERLVEPSGVVHLLYPDQGLDLAVSESDKEVILYVPPRDFDRVALPLRLLR